MQVFLGYAAFGLLVALFYVLVAQPLAHKVREEKWKPLPMRFVGLYAFSIGLLFGVVGVLVRAVIP